MPVLCFVMAGLRCRRRRVFRVGGRVHFHAGREEQCPKGRDTQPRYSPGPRTPQQDGAEADLDQVQGRQGIGSPSGEIQRPGQHGRIEQEQGDHALKGQGRARAGECQVRQQGCYGRGQDRPALHGLDGARLGQPQGDQVSQCRPPARAQQPACAGNLDRVLGRLRHDGGHQATPTERVQAA